MLAPDRFVAHPHRTFVALSVPILGSLIAEPLTGLVDTAFVARLGVEPLAALGVGTMVLSALFWALSFLGVATQTRVATFFGTENRDGVSGRAAARMCLVAVVLALVLGAALATIGMPLAGAASRAMGAEARVAELSEDYLRFRFVGAPAMLACFAAFGALRGAHDMRTPLWIAGGMNGLNLALDPLLIFGFAGLPAMGVSGAALASTVSQWVGALWATVAAFRCLGRPDGFDWRQAQGLLVAGVDLFLRAACLNGFLILGTWKATAIGAGSGAVHQVVRSTWFFNALFMDSFAISAQSLVAHFLGAGDRAQARRVARVTCKWSCGAGAALGLAMIVLETGVSRLYIPPVAAALFSVPWRIAALTQPISGLTFGTDGVHFGSGDFKFLRNAVVAALVVGAILVLWADPDSPGALNFVWWSFTVWTSVRAVAGTLRIWPGFGTAPLARQR